MPTSQSNTLEYRLFIMGCLISMFVSFVLFITDTFIAKEYDSSVIEAASFIIFFVFYYQVKYKGKFEKALTPFAIILLIIVNLAWFTGGGLNLTNAFIFFLILILILIISPKYTRPGFVVAIFVNLVIFSALEFSYPEYSMPVIKNNQLLIVNTIVLLVVFSIGAYVLLFFKNQYDLERETVKKQNIELDSSSSEMEAQNEELQQYQEEVMAQRDFIEEKNRILETQAIELENANAQIQAINSSLEQTVEERTKNLLELNNDLDLLVYRSSHDFRRPLTTLMGLNEIARLTVKDELSKELFNKVNKTAVNMDKMLLKFFMLYNINHFRTTYEGNTLDEIVDKIENNMISRKRNITFNRKIELVNYNNKDERNSLIEIILENLVENSLIYNREDHMVIDLEIDEKDGYLHILERDNGNGIHASFHQKIFEMYFRGSTLSTGNGLGLYVAKRAADLLKASITLDSKEGAYTQFEFEFKI